MIQNCPFPDRCFTSFPCSSASAASFNRTLWHKTGSAQIDEVRGMYNSVANLSGGGPVLGLHIRGPQLNPQRDPRWGRNDNSPGECVPPRLRAAAVARSGSPCGIAETPTSKGSTGRTSCLAGRAQMSAGSTVLASAARPSAR